jgi:ubiquinone/menaquinone biosynthesis C-methylase UbiE
MKTALFLVVATLLCSLQSFGQQNAGKLKKIRFCGYKYKDTAILRRHFEKQLAFLEINDGDTIADIGSSSGAYIGALNVIGDFKHVHFILVDIDSNCLNTTRVSNMTSHYEGLRGSPFRNSISFVQNTVDSLYLPVNSMKKLWMFNTLHEIPDKKNIISQMAAVLQPGGELVIAELLATEKNKIHGGCHEPLLTEAGLITLMAEAGFSLKNKVVNPIAVKKIRNPYCLYRFIKL